MSEPTIEDVVSMQFWKHVRRYGQIDATNRLLGAAEALMVVLRELERSKYMSTHYQQMEIVDGVLDRLRAALGEE